MHCFIFPINLYTVLDRAGALFLNSGLSLTMQLDYGGSSWNLHQEDLCSSLIFITLAFWIFFFICKIEMHSLPDSVDCCEDKNVRV